MIPHPRTADRVGEVLHDHDLAEAIVERVLESGRLLLLDGRSYRTRLPPKTLRMPFTNRPAPSGNRMQPSGR